MTIFFSGGVRKCGQAAGVLVLALGLAAGCARKEQPESSAKSAPAAKTTAPAAAKSAAAPADSFEKIRGRWLRPDGGYVLAIGAIDPEGRAEARYFNPSPINVAWARVRTDAGVMKLDVELRDTNYPGCLYKLSYLPETDRMVGTYFQAQMQETHEVAFIRDER